MRGRKGNPGPGPGGGFVNGFDLLSGNGAARNVQGPAVAVFVVLPFPDQLRLHLGQRMWIIRSPVWWVCQLNSPFFASGAMIISMKPVEEDSQDPLILPGAASYDLQ